MMLDSSVLIDAERGRLDLESWLECVGDEAVVVSAVTASELLHGVHRARTPAQHSRREAFVEWILREIPVVEFGLAEARVHARLWARLRERGDEIGAHDLLIAATALSSSFRLATGNARDFERVPGLVVERWQGRPPDPESSPTPPHPVDPSGPRARRRA